MTYYIRNTAGVSIAEIVDSNINQTATDLTLIGKNVTGYGEYINDNFIKLLENFSSTSEPTHPIVGQLWFDTSENRLKVYDGSGFRIGSGPIVQGTPPLTPIQGDFWIDNDENLLYFYTGDGIRYAASKLWKDSQGESGFNVTNLTDSNGNTKVVVKLLSAGKLLGIFSTHEEFTPSTLIPEYTGSIYPGFNVGNIANFKFHARATTADALVDTLGNVKTTSSFVFTDIDNSLSGIQNIQGRSVTPTPNNLVFRLGQSGESRIYVNPLDFTISSNNPGQEFRIKTKASPSGTESYAITIKPNTSRVGIWNTDPQAALDVTGDLIVSGNLTVNGSTTTINSVNLTIDDQQIIMASGNTTQAATDGGGFIVQADANITNKSLVSFYNNKSFIYQHDVDTANRHWNSSESINIRSGKSYKINGVIVLSANELASSITQAPGLKTIGTLNQVAAGNIVIGDPVGLPTPGPYANTVRSTSGPIIISPYNHLPISVSGSRVINLQDPQDSGDAVNKNYADGLNYRPWKTVDSSYQSVKNERLFVDTVANTVEVILPANALPGDSVRFFDINGTWNLTPLTIKRFRKVIYLPEGSGGTSGASATTAGPYLQCPTVTVTGVGSGITVNVHLSQNSTPYSSINTNIVVLHVGVDYQSGDQLKVTGNLLGGTSPENDLVFDLSLNKIFAEDYDLVCTTADSSFGLVYTNLQQGWKYSEKTILPAEVVANVRGNIISTNTNSVVINTSASTATFTGNLTGNVNGNVTGTILTASQTNITGLGTLANLTVTNPISANLTGNVTGNLTGNVTGNVTGNLTGAVTTTSISSSTYLLVQTTNNNISLVSGKSGLRISAFDDTAAQEQYAITVTPGTAPGLPSTTYLFGNVVVSNQSTSNINGSSFKLPLYSTTQRDARSLSFLNYGELIYNTSTNTVQAYTNTGWANLN